MLTLYYRPGTCAIASHIALEEAEAEFEPHPVKREERESYLAINPSGKVPALGIDDVVLTENVAIQTYVAKRFPKAKLLPTDMIEEARCLSLLAWFSSTVHISRRQLRVPSSFTPDEAAHKSIAAAGREQFWANLKKIDAMLTGKQWMMDDQFTVADGYAIVFYQWGLVDQLPMHELSAYTAFKSRLVRRPGARRALAREVSPVLQAG